MKLDHENECPGAVFFYGCESRCQRCVSVNTDSNGALFVHRASVVQNAAELWAEFMLSWA